MTRSQTLAAEHNALTYNPVTVTFDRAEGGFVLRSAEKLAGNIAILNTVCLTYAGAQRELARKLEAEANAD